MLSLDFKLPLILATLACVFATETTIEKKDLEENIVNADGDEWTYIERPMGIAYISAYYN